MIEVDLIVTKEQLNESHPECQQTIAIVLDIIFATSSIDAALEAGVEKIYAAYNLEDAIALSKTLDHPDWEIAGEHMAQAFEGFRSYEPLALSDPILQGKDLIYSTTNGTVALRKTANFLNTYAASLRNGQAVIKHILSQLSAGHKILLICSGSHGHFSLEDFYGAGYLVDCLQKMAANDCHFSDSALAAQLCFQNTNPYKVLSSSRLGQYFIAQKKGENIQFISELNCSNTIPILDQGIVRKL